MWETFPVHRETIQSSNLLWPDHATETLRKVTRISHKIWASARRAGPDEKRNRKPVVVSRRHGGML
jgi:hypothetical protein